MHDCTSQLSSLTPSASCAVITHLLGWPLQSRPCRSEAQPTLILPTYLMLGGCGQGGLSAVQVATVLQSSHEIAYCFTDRPHINAASSDQNHG
jgi:hypothetical protein